MRAHVMGTMNISENVSFGDLRIRFMTEYTIFLFKDLK